MCHRKSKKNLLSWFRLDTVLFAGRSSDLRVPLLDLLSRPLFRELQFERHRASLCKLPMVKDVLEAPDIQTLEVLYSTTSNLCQLVAAAGDMIFLSGSHASSSYFKLSGTLAYYHDTGETAVDNSCWVAEACLWTPWIYMGEFEAIEVSDLLCLDADGFCATLSKTWITQRAASEYAREFLETWAVIQEPTQMVITGPFGNPWSNPRIRMDKGLYQLYISCISYQ